MNEDTVILNTTALKEAVITALKQIYDPEIPVNIYDLGLIYNINIANDGMVNITMTLTTPGCPVAQTFPQLIQDKILQVEDVTGANIELVWDPPWTQEMMAEEARLLLGF